ncbi:hypothetical protein BCD67_19660 [Oscillatoriales cyanobacterium USR001]|nr:hypothetical protein BCD67_19660 [Oscillatoriales cyanobacterium USR001]
MNNSISNLGNPGENYQKQLLEILKQLCDRPFTLGLLILALLLPKDLNLLKTRLEYSEKGQYFWLQLCSSFLIEAGICFWPPKQANSFKHDHFNSKALVLTLSGEILQTLYKVSRDKFFIYRQDIAKPLDFLFIDGWQIHGIKNVSNEWAFSLHLYALKRPQTQLEIAED